MTANEKANALAQVDAAAAAQLASVRTSNHDFDFSILHAEKVAEARAWLAARRLNEPEPDVTAFPLLAAELGITAPTMPALVDIIRVKHASFIAFAADVEAMRLAAKKAIRQANTISDINSVLSALIWPDAATVV